MGLDAVELVLEAEEAFGISLPDDEMVEAVTVGKFYDAILRQLPCPEKKYCLSAVAFYRLHQPLLAVTGRKHGEVRPTTRLDTLIPRRQRKSAWRKIARLSGLRLPTLCLPEWAVLVALVSAVFVVVGGALVFEWPFGAMLLVRGFVAFFLTCWVVGAVFSNGLPRHLQTVGQLTKAVLAKNFAKLSGEINNFDRNEVWEAVRILVADQLGVGLEKVTKDARFVADLGLS
jgi:acyl carrier protein